jgi:hypothetical protein
MAREESGKSARPQVHADALGLQRFCRAFPVHGHQPGKTPIGLEEADRNLRIFPAELDEVAAELGRTLDFAKVPARKKRAKSWQRVPHTKTRTAGAKHS